MVTDLLRRAISARNDYTRTLTVGGTSKPVLNAGQAAERMFGHVYKDDPNWPTLEDVQVAADRIYNEMSHGGMELAWALQRVGVSSFKVGDIWVGSWPQFIATANAMCDIGGSFGFAYRWLLHHPESNCWWVESDPVKVAEALSDGLVVDVTDIAEHEDAYNRQLGLEFDTQHKEEEL